jgi:hypothetical protein
MENILYYGLVNGIYLVEKYGADAVEHALKVVAAENPILFEDPGVSLEKITELVEAYLEYDEDEE